MLLHETSKLQKQGKTLLSWTRAPLRLPSGRAQQLGVTPHIHHTSGVMSTIAPSSPSHIPASASPLIGQYQINCDWSDAGWGGISEWNATEDGNC
jgi:hypothetical protein